MTTMPTGLDLWTADEVAECLSGLGSDLVRKLWRFVEAAENPTPLGGDGSNGTVEEPSGRLSLENDDKAGHWWGLLTENERETIAESFQKEFGDD